MKDIAAQDQGGAAPVVTLRPEQPGDEGFLYEVYASTRQEELALTGWDEAMRRAFLAQQFGAMRVGYRGSFPAAEFAIILQGAEPVGRMVIDRGPESIRVVDLALLPAHCHRGLGTLLLRRVCAEAAAAGRPVRLSVLKQNRAVGWYERLGFRRIAEAGPYDEMEWRPEAG